MLGKPEPGWTYLSNAQYGIFNFLSSQTLKCLTHLDLHSNKFATFPSFMLKMPSVIHLDASRNDIGPTVVLDPVVKCPSLKQFNLSYNQLSSIPENLDQVVEKLEQLLLEG